MHGPRFPAAIRVRSGSRSGSRSVAEHERGYQRKSWCEGFESVCAENGELGLTGKSRKGSMQRHVASVDARPVAAKPCSVAEVR